VVALASVTYNAKSTLLPEHNTAGLVVNEGDWYNVRIKLSVAAGQVPAGSLVVRVTVMVLGNEPVKSEPAGVYVSPVPVHVVELKLPPPFVDQVADAAVPPITPVTVTVVLQHEQPAISGPAFTVAS
jgi:hypothetical protein